MNEKEINIAQKAYEAGIRRATIGFSTGKDSVVGLDMLIKAGIEPKPIFFYQVPKLQFIEDNLKMYEDYFHVKIVRLTHPILRDHINCRDWQPYHKCVNMMQFTLDTLGHSFKKLTDVYLEACDIKGFDYDCVCMKMADSINRRLVLSKKPDIDHEKKIIYPTKYFTKTEIFDYIKRHNIPLTKDYDIFGISWDGLAYHFLYGVKKFYPNDYKKIKEYFPMIDAEIFRYKLYKKHQHEQ